MMPLKTKTGKSKNGDARPITGGIDNKGLETIELDEPNVVDKVSSFPERAVSPNTDGKESHPHDERKSRSGSLVLPALTIPTPGTALLAPPVDTQPPGSPAHRVRVLLTGHEDQDDDDNFDINFRSLFSQLDVLCHFDDNEFGWKEAARWVKFEEKLEAGDRWSKPHVSTTSLHALFEIRRGIADGSCLVLLDMNASHGCMHQVAENIVSAVKKAKGLSEEKAQRILDVLMSPHKHKHRKNTSKKGKELEEIKLTMDTTQDTTLHDENDDPKNSKFKMFKKRQERSSLHHKYPHTIYPGGFQADTLMPHKPNKRLMAKIAGGSEAANILIGQVDFLQEPIMVLCRLEKSAVLADLTEVAIPTRFLYVLLGPESEASMWDHVETGRAMAAFFSDKVFCEVAYMASNARELVDGMDEFMDDLKVLPPSIWDPSTRLQPPDQTMTMAKIKNRLTESGRTGAGQEGFHFQGGGYEEDPALQRTGMLFGGLWMDVKRRGRLYISDFRDGIHPQCLASVVFLYFACITPIVTFGGLLGSATHGYMGTMETLVSGAMCGIIYHLFSGQPLTIVGATGPMLVFESMLFKFSKENHFDFLGFRFWIGMWVSLILFIIVAFDLSSLVKYITRFTEESFAVLISLIFIVEAFTKVAGIWSTHPVDINPVSDVDPCYCQDASQYNVTGTAPPLVTGNITTKVYPTSDIFNVSDWGEPYFQYEECITYNSRIIVTPDCVTEEQCLGHGWGLSGESCSETQPVADVFFLSLFLFLGTFCIAYFLRTFRNSPFFSSTVRSTASDFAVLTAILICTGVDAGLGLATPKLMVPPEFKTTRPDRGWLVDPAGIAPKWWLIPVALVPALLACILIFLDQQITAVIVNRKEHKLKKTPGYHLDLFVLSILIGVCSLLGLPWFVAATVRSVTHVRTLFRESELRAPGEKTEFLGVREQRLTGLSIHILIGVSVLLTSVLKFIPMPVLFGVFLYMGVTSLAGVQFTDRILILLMPQKHQPDYAYLRHVATKRVHIFTMIQIACMVSMWAVKSVKKISLLFPIMVLALCFVRKGMDWIFTQNEMYWLDHLLPETTQKKKDDREGDELEALDDVPVEDEWNQIMMNRDYPVGGVRPRRMSLEVIQRGLNKQQQQHQSNEALPGPTTITEEDEDAVKTASPSIPRHQGTSSA